MRYRVRVLPSGKKAEVVLRKRFAGYGDHIMVSRIDLTQDGADDELAEARARATSLAHQVNGLERDRL